MLLRTYIRLVTFIFLLVGILHFYRAFKGYQIFIGSLHIAPAWSWIAGVLSLYLAYQGFKHSRR